MTNGIAMYGVLVGMALSVPLGDIWWVDAINGSLLGSGSESDPFLRITQGLSNASALDTVKVKKGFYNAALGETFPLPVPSEVSVIGVDYGDEPGDFARIGGDLSDADFTGTDIKALMVIDGRDSAREDIVISNLIFLGQDDPGFDAPSALAFVGESQNCTISGNTFHRGEMNDTGDTDRATIVIGGVDGSTIHPSSIESNVIEASSRGAIEFAGVASGSVIVGSNFAVLGNTILNPSGTTSEFGIYWNGLTGPIAGGAQIFSNQILSSGDGIGKGIAIEVKSFGSETSTFHPGKVVGNLIQGCAGDAVTLTATVTNIRLESFARNTIRDNGGSGMSITWDPAHAHDGAADINNRWIEGNLIVGNGGFAYRIRGLGPESKFPMKVINDTIADNSLGAFGFDSWVDENDQITVTQFADIFQAFANLILWENNSGGSGAQVVGLNQALLDEFIARTSYSNWQNLPGTPANGNLDTDPLFINSFAGNYHLDVGSPCIDSGRVAVGVTAVVDIDLQDRVQDGDHTPCERPAVAQVDRGSDEVSDPCEE
jgi:hypothetical protein